MGAKTTAESDQYESFLAHYSLAQTQVQAFIRSLVHDRTAADDVYQTTSLALWRKFPTFRADAEFLHWALGVARKEVGRSAEGDLRICGRMCFSIACDVDRWLSMVTRRRCQSCVSCCALLQ